MPDYSGKYMDGNGLARVWDKVKALVSGKLIPSGGLAGQVLAKSSGADYDVTWVAQSGGGGGYGPGDSPQFTNVDATGVISASGGLSTLATVTAGGDITSGGDIEDGSGNVLSAKQDAITAGTGLEFSGSTLNHSNSVTAGTIGSSSASSGATVAVPYATYDAQGHITGKGTHTHTINSLAASVIGSGTFDAARIPSLAVSKISDLSYTERAAYYSTSITNGTSAYTSASTTGWTILDFGDTYVAFGFVSASVSCSTAFGPYYIQSADRYMRLPFATANIIACIFGTAFGGASNSGISCVLRGNNANYLPTSGSLYGIPFRFTSPSSFSTAATQKVPVLLVGRKSS